ncbi:uncharacterized protein LOC111133058 [Crassostrea virginica]
MYLHIQRTIRRCLVFIEFAIQFSTVIGQEGNVNLPSKITVSENTKTGVVVFSLEPGSYALVNAFPEITTNAFSYSGETGEVAVQDSSLLDYDGNHKSFVMRFEEGITEVPRKRKRAVGEDAVGGDLVLLIELQDVQETSDSSSCCSDVSTIKWLVPVCSGIELLTVIIWTTILLFCLIKKK